MASVKLTPLVTCLTARFDDRVTPPPPVDHAEFQASLARINAAIKPTLAYYAAIAAIPLSILLGIILLIVGAIADRKKTDADEDDGTGKAGGASNRFAILTVVAIICFSGSCVSCCLIAMIKKRWTTRFFNIVSSENEYWAGRTPSVQWRMEVHQRRILHLSGSRSGAISARTSVQHSYDLHLDVAGGAPVAVVLPVVAFAQPQQLYQPPAMAGYHGQPQYQYGQPHYAANTLQPIQMQQMAQQQQPGMYYQQQPMGQGGMHQPPPPPNYQHYQPPPVQQQSDSLSTGLLSHQSPSEQ